VRRGRGEDRDERRGRASLRGVKGEGEPVENSHHPLQSSFTDFRQAPPPSEEPKRSRMPGSKNLNHLLISEEQRCRDYKHQKKVSGEERRD